MWPSASVGDVPLSGGCSPHRVGQRCGDYAAQEGSAADEFGEDESEEGESEEGQSQEEQSQEDRPEQAETEEGTAEEPASEEDAGVEDAAANGASQEVGGSSGADSVPAAAPEQTAQPRRGRRKAAAGAGKPAFNGVDTAAVRAWAAANGLTVSPRGRIKDEVIEAYRAAGN